MSDPAAPPLSPLKQVISGGQIGADIAGLRAAKLCGLQTGGWMPKGFRTTIGPLDPALVAEYELMETEGPSYPERTRKNVQAADGTIQLAYNWQSPGERLTTKLIKQLGQPCFAVPLYLGPDLTYMVLNKPTMVLLAHEWIHRNSIEILNVAGNANTLIEAPVENFLIDLFVQLRNGLRNPLHTPPILAAEHRGP